MPPSLFGAVAVSCFSGRFDLLSQPTELSRGWCCDCAGRKREDGKPRAGGEADG
jgi:hypothetical protein